MKNFGSQKDVAIFQGIHGKREGFMIYSNTSQPKDFFNIKRKKTYQCLFFIGKKVMFKLVDNFFFFWGRCVVFVFLSLFLESQKFATRINLERCSWLQKIAQNRNSLDLVQPQKKKAPDVCRNQKGEVSCMLGSPQSYLAPGTLQCGEASKILPSWSFVISSVQHRIRQLASFKQDFCDTQDLSSLFA